GFMKQVCAGGPQLEDTYNFRNMQTRRCKPGLGSTLMTELGENRGLCLSVRIHDDVRSADALFRQTRFNGYAQLVILLSCASCYVINNLPSFVDSDRNT